MNDAPHDRHEYPAENDLPDQDHRGEEDREPERDTFFRDLIRFTIISIAIVVPLRIYVAQPFIVQGSSMDPTFETGNYLIVDQLSYHFDDPERGEVVIFRYPQNPSKFFIKRVVGLPNERVSLENGAIVIYNGKHPDGFTLDDSFITHQSRETLMVDLASDEYFVVGDNRTSSSDSRLWGALEEKYIVGRAFLRLFPLQNLGYLPGDRELTSQ